MLRFTGWRRLILTLSLALLPLTALAQPSGTISGRITDAARENPLPGASVMLEGTSRGTATDDNGRYVLRGVPAGVYTVRISFLGYRDETLEVTVESGMTVIRDVSLESETIEVGELTVLGVRARGQAEALSRQRSAANIKNIIAADQMGRFPDPSAPAALQRVPGITVQRDQGEARYVQIRGGSPEMTSVAFNGVNIPSPEGEERQIALDAIPIDILGSLEVNKAVTPDMDAEATGGAVNLVTKRPPSEETFRAEVGSGYGTLREKVTGNGSLTYGNQFGNVGVLLSGSYNHRRFGSDDVEAAYSLEDDPSQDVLEEVESRYYHITRARSGVTGLLDYAFNPNSRIYLNGVWTRLYDEEFQPNVISVIPDGAIEFEHKDRVETAQTFNLTAGGEHLLAGGTQLSYKGAFIQSREDTPIENELLFIREGVSFSPRMDGPIANPDQVGQLEFDELVEEEKVVENQDVVLDGDLSIPYQLGTASGTFDFGGKFRNKNAKQEVDIFEYGLTDGASDILLGRDVGEPFSVEGYNPGSDYKFPDHAVQPEEIRDFSGSQRFGGSLEREKDVEGDSEDYDILERTVAGYAMTELNLTDRLLILPGLRYEHTSVDADGYQFNPNGEEEIVAADEEKQYGQLFPMLHLRYRPGSQTNVRAAITRTLSRPNYFFMVPFSIRDEDEIERGNPNLDPMTSFNYDLMLEHYSQRVGVISAGAFAKQLTDPIFMTTFEEGDLEITQPQNASSAEILGLEMNVSQQLRFLPEPLDGLGLYANYTRTWSQATLPSGRETDMPGQADHTYNLALSYEKAGFSGQLSGNYHTAFIEELGAPLESEYIDEHVQLDLSASYQFTPQLSLSFELQNLTNRPHRLYVGRSSRPIQQEYYEQWGRLSLQYQPF